MTPLTEAVLGHFRSVLGEEVILLRGDGFKLGLWNQQGTNRMWNVTVGLCDGPSRCELAMLSRQPDTPRFLAFLEDLSKQPLRRGLVVPLEPNVWKRTTPTAVYLGFPHRAAGLQPAAERVDVHWVVPILESEQVLSAEELDGVIADPKIDFTNLKRVPVTKR